MRDAILSLKSAPVTTWYMSLSHVMFSMLMQFRNEPTEIRLRLESDGIWIDLSEKQFVNVSELIVSRDEGMSNDEIDVLLKVNAPSVCKSCGYLMLSRRLLSQKQLSLSV